VSPLNFVLDQTPAKKEMDAQLQAALQALYHHADASLKEQANKWLEQWQQSQEAWQGAVAVLQAPEAGLEAQYFAAQTLRTKAQRDFDDLPPAAALSLRDSLVTLLLRFARGPAPVRTQLCLAVAALAAHLPSAQWGEAGVVGWLAQRLGPEPPADSLPAMLDLMTVLAQEAGGYQPAVRPERRRQAHAEMTAAVPQALAVLGSCLEGAGEHGRQQALEAFAAWLRLGGGEGVGAAALAASPLTAAALQGLRSPDSFHAAAEAVVELIYCTSHRGRPRPEMGALVQAVVVQVMALRPRFAVAAQQAVAERDGAPPPDAGDHPDAEEDAKATARLFAEVGEAYTDLIAGGAAEVLPPVEALLDVAAHPEDAIAAMSFNFWHRLSRALTTGLHPQPLNSQEEALPEDERARRLAVFRPTFERLVALVRGRVRFPDGFDSWHREERADFKRGRMAVGDLLVDAAAVLGGGPALRVLAEPLLELSARVAGGGEFDWRGAEAALYCIRCVHRAAPPPGDPLLAALFGALPGLPAPPPLQYTAALTVGAYADWLGATAGATPEGQRLVGALMEMLIKGGRPPFGGVFFLCVFRDCAADRCRPLPLRCAHAHPRPALLFSTCRPARLGLGGRGGAVHPPHVRGVRPAAGGLGVLPAGALPPGAGVRRRGGGRGGRVRSGRGGRAAGGGGGGAGGGGAARRRAAAVRAADDGRGGGAHAADPGGPRGGGAAGGAGRRPPAAGAPPGGARDHHLQGGARPARRRRRAAAAVALAGGGAGRVRQRRGGGGEDLQGPPLRGAQRRQGRGRGGAAAGGRAAAPIRGHRPLVLPLRRQRAGQDLWR
jgi:hypothetical protein